MVDDERIWAPWRIGYITADGKSTETQIVPNKWLAEADHDCFLCRAAAEYTDVKSAHRQNLIIARTNQVVCLLNRFPYNNGHLMVAPLRHVADLSDLTDAEHLAAMHMLGDYTRILGEKICAEGFNVGLNLGKVGGAGVPGHLHWHLVPRWPGDTNFMASVAGIRVIPQSLEALWEALIETEGDHAG
jgi:ATP adenylyltransferase